MRLVVGAVALALAAGASACGSAAATSAAHSTPATAGPANPVTMIRQAGATPDPGEVYGSTSLDGWLYASGSYGPSNDSVTAESITVYTLPAGTTGQQAVEQVGPAARSSDSQTVITGSDFYAYVEPGEIWSTTSATPRTVWTVPAAAIAARLHGTVMAPS